jgi:hypothetical protein
MPRSVLLPSLRSGEGLEMSSGLRNWAIPLYETQQHPPSHTFDKENNL